MSDERRIEILAEAKYLRLAKFKNWEFVQRKGASGVVAIVAVTDERKIILIEQERPVIGARLIEVPAGLAGDVAGQEGEDLSEAARRELLEETGYACREMVRLGQGYPSSGLTDESITYYRATGLTRESAGGGEGPGEQIVVHEIHLDHVEAWLAEQVRAGKKLDLKVFGALWFAMPPR